MRRKSESGLQWRMCLGRDLRKRPDPIPEEEVHRERLVHGVVHLYWQMNNTGEIFLPVTEPGSPHDLDKE